MSAKMDDNKDMNLNENNSINEIDNQINDNKDELEVNESEDNSENETITMLDVLQEQQELEDNAFAVLAGSDDKHCTYLRGYVNRQALYACNTCSISGDENAGICLACSYTCHENHDLFELYTKRDFRCDCGNNKFTDNKCKLYPKTSINEKNEYNHNFKGIYCSCERPYPDPESDVEDQMIQCIVCEDWFHGRHLGVFPENEDFAEMICSLCMNRLPFLWIYYSTYGEKINIENAETSEDLNAMSLNSNANSNPESGESAKNKPKSESMIGLSESDSGIENSCDSVVTSIPSNSCKLSVLKLSSNGEQPKELTSTYWPLSWRSNLCKCADCMSLYIKNKCLFLTNEKDMVHYYENEGMQSNTKVSHYDKGISELKKMNRIQQIEYISGYNDLKNDLKDYLQKFVDSNKVVREEDIKEFFDEIKSRKRQRTDIPYNCK